MAFYVRLISLAGEESHVTMTSNTLLRAMTLSSIDPPVLEGPWFAFRWGWGQR